jgi:hypothetical protein
MSRLTDITDRLYSEINERVLLFEKYRLLRQAAIWLAKSLGESGFPNREVEAAHKELITLLNREDMPH